MKESNFGKSNLFGIQFLFKQKHIIYDGLTTEVLDYTFIYLKKKKKQQKMFKKYFFEEILFLQN